MFIFFDVGEYINFVNCALFQFFVLFEATHLDDFDRILPTVVFVNSPVDLAVSPLSDYLVERVVFDYADHELFCLNNNYSPNRKRKAEGQRQLAICGKGTVINNIL